MKPLLLSVAVLVTVAGICFVTADDQSGSAARGPIAVAQKDAGPRNPVKKEAGSPSIKPAPGSKTPESKPVAATMPKRSPDEEAVIQAGAALAKAFNQHDGKTFAAVFTADGEYVDEKWEVYHGRKAIEDDSAAVFKTNPEAGIEVQLVSTRVIAPGIIAADGVTRFIKAKGEPPVAGRCSLFFTKDGGKWLIASLRETQTADEQASHHEQVKQLEFLVGEWLNQGGHSDVHFTCRWDEGLNFLLRDFAVHVAGQKTMTGTQRIGYDPLTGHLKAWIFDSAGGYADGYFHREGETWILQTSGVTADGRMASGTQIFGQIDKHRLSWQPVDYVIGGERMSDTPQVTIVRKPPTPTTTAK
jgi:uncharacterized protein (TIGR02246 family)